LTFNFQSVTFCIVFIKCCYSFTGETTFSNYQEFIITVLITLVAIHPCLSPQSVPLANAFLKAYAADSGVSIDLVDFFLDQEVAFCAMQIAESHPVAVGFSLYVWNRELCSRVAAQLRQMQPNIRLFCGGPEATADSSGVAHEGIFDCIFLGEGETAFLQFCQSIATDTTVTNRAGIAAKGIQMISAAPLTDLDSIASPYLTGVIDLRAHSGLLWQLSRGCAFSCDFCFDARGIHGVRRFSLARIESELHYFAANGVSQIFVLDSTFNQDVRRAKTILRLIKKIAPNIHFHFEVRSEFIDEELAGLFAQITCSLQIGLQSSSAVILAQVGRSFRQDDFTAKIGLLNDSGAVFGFDLIYGLPDDTLKGFCTSLDYALSLYPNHLDIFPLAVLPATRLFQRGAELKLFWMSAPPYTLISTESFTRAEMAAAGHIAVACDIFYTRGKAVAWFNSVTNILQLKPSRLFQLFANWLSCTKGANLAESDFDDDAIWQMQREFLTQLFSPKQLIRFLPLVLDLVDYHHCYASALLTSPPDPLRRMFPRKELLTAPFRLAGSTQVAHFRYEIQEILECGAPDIRWIQSRFSPRGSQAVIYPKGGQICTESLDSSYITLLEHINEGFSAGTILKKIRLTRHDAEEFLQFAQEEGIITGAE
jgi:hypothetical protein